MPRRKTEPKPAAPPAAAPAFVKLDDDEARLFREFRAQEAMLSEQMSRSATAILRKHGCPDGACYEGVRDLNGAIFAFVRRRDA